MFDVRGKVGGSVEVVTSKLCCQRKVDSCSLMDCSFFFFPPQTPKSKDVTMRSINRLALVRLVFL